MRPPQAPFFLQYGKIRPDRCAADTKIITQILDGDTFTLFEQIYDFILTFFGKQFGFHKHIVTAGKMKVNESIC